MAPAILHDTATADVESIFIASLRPAAREPVTPAHEKALTAKLRYSAAELLKIAPEGRTEIKG
jgi:hypothetical protein